MAEILCEAVTEGLRASEGLAAFRDYQGRRHFLRVERDFLTKIGDNYYLPVGVVHIDPRTNLVLVELDHEAETGANRLWVKQEQLDKPVEQYA
jgi:hypothetical protein